MLEKINMKIKNIFLINTSMVEYTPVLFYLQNLQTNYTIKPNCRKWQANYADIFLIILYNLKYGF